MLLYYMRHADPIYNPDSLTPLGERQAEALARRLSAHGIDKIFASSSNRAQLTAKPTAEITKNDVTVLDWANEVLFFKDASTVVDESTGRKVWMMHQDKYRELFTSPELHALGDKWYEHPEIANTRLKAGLDRVQRDTDAFMAALGYEHDREHARYKAIAPNEERVAFFAHQGFGIAFLSCLLDIPYPLFSTRFDINHSGMTVIKFDGNNTVYPMVVTYSNDSHLYRDGLPTRLCNGRFI